MTENHAVSPALAELADACGVASSFEDAHGVRREVPASTLRAVLAALGVEVTDDDGEGDLSAREALEAVRLGPWRRVLPPTLVARQGTAIGCPVHVPRGAIVNVAALLEDTDEPVSLLPLDEPRIAREVDGMAMERVAVEVPGTIPVGWHRVTAVVEAPGIDPVSGECTLLVYPSVIPVPAGIEERRAVGLAAQLYQVRSDESWGVGDLADLGELAGWAGRDLGADFVLVNPMHAGEPFAPVSPSPYLPTTRRFSSPLYLRPELVPEYGELSDDDRRRVEGLAHTAAAANTDDTIDRDGSWTRKLEALRILFTVPLSGGRAESFDRFVEQQGPGILGFATWSALAGAHGPDWSAWPEDLQDPESEAVARFAEENSEEIRFHLWLQWLVGEQRAHAHRAAVDSGMRLGILHDLAVGVHPTGADAWSLNRSLARGVSVGAPPDVYNQRGQDWSQPPLRPDALAQEGYRPFRDIVRAALRDSGGVRIDHILGLFRLWWIPRGSAPTEGTYVHYDHEAMLGVLALEASRAGAVVVGEDLGTVAPGVRETLSELGVLGTSVMWFEQDDDAPIPPEDYRRLCMASVTTHDLPPTAGYAELVHVDVREELGQLTGDVAAERRGAAAEIEAFTSAVRERGLLEGDSPDDLVVALHRFVAGSPSLLFAVSVSDLVGDRRPVNIPGTSDEYPNWRVPLSGPTGEVVGMETLRASTLADRVMKAAGAPRR
ncbi:4-alpha-glucanotransferase [Dietzia sp. B32]|uniref:4-alpha-glucanotransferase n=1 Tax=Dietzia sp. B32 TaxID=2915130 RepID=UPI0021AD6BAF|nr:4-alpha-glucanotransferase [Dietzia sp. B32]UVE94988.1 4-alpha-glucanotransferase [Dietzia sp. B32]